MTEKNDLTIEFIAARGIGGHGLPGIDLNVKKITELTGEESPVVPAKKFMPDWYKKMDLYYPSDDYAYTSEVPTVKTCPGIHDYLNAGYIIPAWADMRLEWVPGSNNEWRIATGKVHKAISEIHSEVSESLFSGHEYDQAPEAPFWKNSCRNIIKIITPWYIKVPKGVSVMFAHPYYHTTTDFTIMPGMMDTDMEQIANKTINCFLKINTQERAIFIEKGAPLLQIIPFVRTNFTLKCNTNPTEEDYDELEKLFLKRQSMVKLNNDEAKELTESSCPFGIAQKNPNLRLHPMKNNRIKQNKNYE